MALYSHSVPAGYTAGYHFATIEAWLSIRINAATAQAAASAGAASAAGEGIAAMARIATLARVRAWQTKGKTYKQD